MKQTGVNYRFSINQRELATILAALRFHQDENLQNGQIPDTAINDIATDAGALRPLNFKEVDELCERLNTSEGSPAKGLVIDPPHEEHGEEPLFRVVYVIDVNAANTRDAANQTYRIMIDSESQPPVLEIIDHQGSVVSLDLSEEPQTSRQSEPISLQQVIRKIHDLLYLEMRDGQEFYNPDKNWNADTIEMVAEIIAEIIPRPEVKP